MHNIQTKLTTIISSLVSFTEKHLTPKRLAIVCGVGYIMSLLPILYLARYSHPWWDDYLFGAATYHAWQDERSIVSVISAAATQTVGIWQTTQGTFSSMFMATLMPAIFGRQFYFLTTWMALLALTLSVIYFFHILLCQLLSINKHLCHIISFVTLFMMVQFMYQRLIFETFFYYTSVCVYILAQSAGFAFIAVMASFFAKEHICSKKRICTLIFASLLGIYVGGGGYPSALFTMIVAVIIIFFAVRKLSRPTWLFLMIPFALFTFSFLINVFAPGNLVREIAGGLVRISLVQTIISSFYVVLRGNYLVKSMTVLIFLAIIFLTPIFYKAAKQTTFSFRYPLAVSFLSLCLLTSSVTPPMYMGLEMLEHEQDRIQAGLYISFILILVLNMFYIIGWICKNWRIPGELVDCHKQFSRLSIKVISISMIVIVSIMGLYVKEERHQFTFSSAMWYIYSGEARAYSDANYEWERIIMEADNDTDIILPPISTRIPMLRAHQNFMVKAFVPRYYGVKSAQIDGEEEDDD